MLLHPATGAPPMSFYLKYELARLLSSDGAKTFQAVEKATRRNVLLHLVDKTGSPELVAKIKRVRPGSRPDVVEIGEFAGSLYIVTDPIEEFEGLGPWLDSGNDGTAGKTAPSFSPPEEVRPKTSPTVVDLHLEAPPPASNRPAMEKSEPGEFTRLFGEAHKPSARPAAAPPPPAAPMRHAAPLNESPGEFTKLFGEASPPKGQSPAPPPRHEGAAPGDFTQKFGAATPAPAPPRPQDATPLWKPAEPPASPPAQSSAGAGEFTRLFGGAPSAPKPPDPAPPPPKPSAPPANPPPQTSSSGEFTRLFGAAPSMQPPPTQTPPLEKPAASAPAPPARAGQGEFTQLFGEAPKAPPPPPAAAKEGPGEFTQLFGGGGNQQESVPRLEPKGRQGKGDIEKSSGEFTRLFGPSGQGSQAPKNHAPPPPAYGADPIEKPLAGDRGPGEFTRMFGNSSAAKSPKHGSPPPGRPSPASFGEGLVGDISGDEALSPEQGPRVSKQSRPFRQAGEFTRMFGPSDNSQAAPQDFIPAAQKGDGYASGLFRNPHSEPKPASAGSAGAGPGQGGKQVPPGAYTLMFEKGEGGGQGAPAAPQPAPPAAAITPAAPASSKPGKGMLIALIAAVLVAGLSLGTAIYLLLNRSSDEPADANPPAIEQPADTPSRD